MSTRLYLSDQAPGYDPPTIRGAWDYTTDATATKALTTSKVDGVSGFSTRRLNDDSNNTEWDMLAYRYTYGPLAAGTITGPLTGCISVCQGAFADAKMFWHIYAYVTQGATDTVRGVLVNDYRENAPTAPFPGTVQWGGYALSVPVTDVVVQSGDYLVIEFGCVARNPWGPEFLYFAQFDSGAESTKPDATPGMHTSNEPAGWIEFSTLDPITARVSQLAGLVLVSRSPGSVATPPTGGGTVPAGTNPSAGVDLCPAEIILPYVDITPPPGPFVTKRYNKVGINKLNLTTEDPRVESFGQITRSLVDRNGSLRGSMFETVIIDTDRTLRDAEATDSLTGGVLEVYLTTPEAIDAGHTGVNAPRRVFSGVITEAIPESGLRMRLQASDYVQSLIDRLPTPTYPQRVFTLTDFPNMGNDPSDPVSPGNPAMLGKPVPIGYGALSDEGSAVPVGVVPGIYTGKRLIPGMNHELDEYVFFGHAPSPTAWALFVPTGIGPAFGKTRERITAATGSGPYYYPGVTGAWTIAFGSANHVVINGRTYCVCYAEGPPSELNRSGQVPLLANLGGVESVGDGTGTMIDSLPRQILHLLNNFVFQNWQTGAWLSYQSMGQFPSYSRLRTTSFEDVRTRTIARVGGSGYIGAFLLGYDGNTQTLAGLAKLFHDHGLDLGVNKDGQVIASMITPGAASVRSVSDIADTIANTFRARRRRDFITNYINYRYARNYVPAQPLSTPPEGDPLPPPPTTKEWLQTPTAITNSTSITKYGERQLDLPLELTRDAVTATDIATFHKEVRSPGPLENQYKEGVCGTNVDLGDKVLLTHFEGVTATGYTDRSMRCERHVLDLDELTVETENLDLTGL